MADVGAWTAAATACAAAIGTVVAAVRQPADVAALRAEVKTAREELPTSIKTAIDAVSVLIDPRLRADINALAKRITDIEDWRKRYRDRERDRDRSPDTQRGQATSGPDLLAATDVEHARRIAHLEARADRVDTALADAREKLAGILATVQSILALRGGK